MLENAPCVQRPGWQGQQGMEMSKEGCAIGYLDVEVDESRMTQISMRLLPFSLKNNWFSIRMDYAAQGELESGGDNDANRFSFRGIVAFVVEASTSRLCARKGTAI
jgi:hypothetical protein